MSLPAGTRLAEFEIVEPTGAGGMGVVYRSRDTKLGRDVAIKVLPDELADSERLRRFEREARLLAALSHSHIATLHGFLEHEGTPFLVMELVPGETLEKRLARGRLSIEEWSTILAITLGSVMKARIRNFPRIHKGVGRS